MHYDAESFKTANETIIRESSRSDLEARLELKINKIRKEFAQVEKLITSYDPSLLASMVSLFDMSKPVIAREILDARNLLLEAQIALGAGSSSISRLDQQFEMQYLNALAQELEKYQALLLGQNSFIPQKPVA
ncbi:hypothetical protein GCM10017044_13620 [Kordiimonas sediminis]|uniref:Uncharacterized protein n=1 Tax=Kordiimonas sediminis TaxID=1735581 RepID=A0A919E7I4_9PROT|nr:hypothetical protein [Kordiimonas sediminis]GHF20109.1 hypothetical protein GCM10017044_13620 [Kordiimonas sediminis]